MSNRKTDKTAGDAPVRHPESGRKYTLEELEALADEGDPWAMTKTDEWDLHFSNEYRATVKERCPVPECELFGEPATFCYGSDGQLMDIEHDGWAHPPAARWHAKAS
ncbi:hypothetical protein ACFFON_13705 [Arthrobacter citreus]|uniref:hypothetical protein n=1 Tax=Arthrobacter TaxID=1663 RepID=UPI001264C318|nr:hypothetical protein [Arthrobacter gandavensis]